MWQRGFKVCLWNVFGKVFLCDKIVWWQVALKLQLTTMEIIMDQKHREVSSIQLVSRHLEHCKKKM